MNEKSENSLFEEMGKSVLNKFVNEEIMTKNELDNRLDIVMQKYTLHIDKKFAHIDEKFNHMEGRFKILLTVMGISIATTISLITIVLKLH